MKLSQEEINALMSYSGYSHAQMNAIMNFDPELVKDNEDLGFVLDFSKEEIEKNIEKIKLIYSAMYKYSREKRGEKLVYRGTNTREIDRIKDDSKYLQFLSTSGSESVADMFASLDNATKAPSKLELKIKDVPYIYMPDVYAMSENEIDRTDEDEILVAPFTSINNIKAKDTIGRVPTFSAEISGFDRDSVSDVSKINEEQIVENYSDLAEVAKEYSKIKFELKRLEQAKQNDKTLTETEYNEIKNGLNGKLVPLEEKISIANKGMEEYLKASFIEIEKNIEKEIEEEKNEEIKNRPKKLCAEVDSSKRYLDYQINSIKSQIERMKSKLNITGMEKVEELGIDLSQVKNEISTDFLNNFQKALDRLEEAQNEINSIIVNENMDEKELSSVASKLHEKEDYIRDISSSFAFLDAKILPQAMNKYTEEIKSKINEKVSEKLHVAEVSMLNKKLDENKKRMNSPFAKFGKSAKSMKLMDEYLTNRLNNKGGIAEYDSINPDDSLDEYIKNSGNSSLDEFSQKLKEVPSNLKNIASHEKYKFDTIPEIPSKKDEIEKFEIDMELMLAKQKNENSIEKSNNSRFRRDLESGVKSSDLSYRFEKVFRDLRNLSKDEEVIESSIDISDYLRNGNEQSL